jgi:SAM-dependent methyltransferase
MSQAFEVKEVKKPEIKLDFGCGPNPVEGFIGVDSIKFPKVEVVMNIAKDKWPWEDSSVIEARASHFIEHLSALERVYFVNELYRILAPGGKFQIVVPHWDSCRAYGDPTHVWPPVSEFWFYYLNKEWRKVNAPHTDIEHFAEGFNCDFDATWGYSLRQDLLTRNQEYQQFAIQNYKEVCQDIIGVLVKK